MGVSNWEIVSLGEIVDVNPPRSLKKGGVVKKVAMENVTEHQRKIAAWTYEEFRGSGARFAQHDILLARITPSLENGKTAFVDVLAENETAYGSTEFIILAARENITDPLFVYYLTRSPDFRQYAIKSMSGTSGRQRVPTDALEKYEVVLPPLPEQRRIARILGSLDDKIELNCRINATLEAMARSLFKSWFVDFDPVRAKMDGRPSGLPAALDALFPDHFVDSDLGKVPAGWEVKRVDDVVEIVGGGTPSTKDPAYWDAGEFAFATPKDLSGLASPFILQTEKTVTKHGLNKISSGLLPKGTLLMSSRAPVGYLAIAAIPVCINQGFIAMKCDGFASNYFLLNWAKENMRLIEGSASGTTFPEISKTNFRPLELLLPSKALLQSFTTLVKPFYSTIESMLKQNASLAKIRDVTLPRLMQGELSN